MKNHLFILFLLFCFLLPASGTVDETFTLKGIQYQITKEDPSEQSFEVSAIHYDSAYIIMPDSVSHGSYTYAVTDAPIIYEKKTCALRHYSKIDLSAAKHIHALLNQTSELIAIDTLILPPNLNYFPKKFHTLDTITHKAITNKDSLLPGIHRVYSTGTQAFEIAIANCTSLLEADLSTHNTTFSYAYHGNSAFACNPFLQKLILPNTTEYFGIDMFYEDGRLAELTIPDSLVSVHNFWDFAFDTLKLGKKVQSISPFFADRWYNLRWIEVDPANPYFMSENGVLYTKNQSKLFHFPHSWQGSEYHLAPQTEIIGSYAFEYDKNLKDLVSQGWDVIKNLPLKKLVFNTALREIQYAAFMCSSITHYIDFENSEIAEIPMSCFARSAIQSVSLPQTIVKIGQFAFIETPDLKSLGSMPSALQTIDREAFRDAWKLEKLDFFECNKLLDIPVWMCLRDSSLTFLALPRNVQTIATEAFRECVSLQEIVCPALTPIPIDSSVFKGVDKKTCVLKVPSRSLNLYKNADVWKDFFNIDANSLFYMETLVSNPIAGTVTGGGVYRREEKATLVATPNAGYRFVQWSDGETQNIRRINMIKDVTLTAEFAPASSTSIDQTNEEMNKCENEKILRDGQLLIERDGKTFNASGAEVR